MGKPAKVLVVDLDAPVQRYVPSYPDKGYPVTPRLLAAHLLAALARDLPGHVFLGVVDPILVGRGEILVLGGCHRAFRRVGAGRVYPPRHSDQERRTARFDADAESPSPHSNPVTTDGPGLGYFHVGGCRSESADPGLAAVKTQ